MPKSIRQISEDRGQKYEFGMGKVEVGIIRLQVSAFELILHFSCYFVPQLLPASFQASEPSSILSFQA